MGYRTFTTLALLLLLSSCEKLRYFSNVNLDIPFTQEFSTPQLDSSIHLPKEGVMFSLPPLAVVTGSAASLQKMGLDTSRLLAVKLKCFSQKIINRDNPDFDFVDSLHMYISAAGLPEVLMAEQNEVPSDADSVVFHCPQHDLKEYFLKDTIYIRMEGRFNSVPAASRFKTDFKFGTTANIIKME